MIKVRKDLALDDIPESLNERKTETRRNTCIRDNKYHQNKKFHERYKQEDITEKLSKIYKNKCAFCEQKIIKCENNNLEDCSSTVEHYRPKSTYYWLAYSWDNLLWCCHRCNQEKDNKFKTLNEPIIYNDNFKENIHSHTQQYNEIEKPFMINPELESILNKLTFCKGKIDSTDKRVKYTIETCKLDRKELNEKRKKVIDEVIKKVNSKKLINEDYSDIFKNLFTDIKTEEKEFISLRIWILQNRANILELS